MSLPSLPPAHIHESTVPSHMNMYCFLTRPFSMREGGRRGGLGACLHWATLAIRESIFAVLVLAGGSLGALLWGRVCYVGTVLTPLLPVFVSPPPPSPPLPGEAATFAPPRLYSRGPGGLLVRDVMGVTGINGVRPARRGPKGLLLILLGTLLVIYPSASFMAPRLQTRKLGRPSDTARRGESEQHTRREQGDSRGLKVLVSTPYIEL
jgi:hypothetical protein